MTQPNDQIHMDYAAVEAAAGTLRMQGDGVERAWKNAEGSLDFRPKSRIDPMTAAFKQNFDAIAPEARSLASSASDNLGQLGDNARDAVERYRAADARSAQGFSR